MKGFEHYEIIDKGGEEFMPALVVVDFEDLPQKLYYTENVIDRLPEPDFSLPFHIITFTMAIAGYFWVSLWRHYVNVVDGEYDKSNSNAKVGQINTDHPSNQTENKTQ